MHAPLAAIVCCSIVIVLRCAASSAFGADLDHPDGFDPSAYPNIAAWETRRDFLRHQALVAQGLWPMPEKTPLHPVIHGEIDRGDYTIEKVFFASLPGHYVSGNLYRPKTARKHPVVLMPHGHWPEGRLMWRSDADATKEIDSGAEKSIEAAHSPLQANCVAVARMGCIVFQYDAVGSADSRKIPHREGFTDADATLRLQSFMGLQTWNSIRALDFVLSLADADDTRVAVTGSSGGGTQTIALAAVDPRVTVSFPMVMVSMNMQGGCVCENAPLYRVLTNNVELACLFAPKPHGAAAANDWTKDFITHGLPEMKSIWRLYNSADLVEGAHVDFGHNHNLHSRLFQYRFLNKHLKLEQPEPIVEKPFQPVPPKELSVYDAEHPMPADFADAATLRKMMTAASDAQITKLTGGEYARTLRIALRAMVLNEKRDLGLMSLHSSTPHKNGNGRAVIWWDPKFVLPASATPLHRYTVYGPNEKPATTAPTTATTRRRGDVNPPYPGGFVLGYNRSPLAEQACALLDMVAQIRRSIPDVKSIDLVSTGDGAPAALLARALAGDDIDRAIIDLGQFDFDKVENDDDP
ncbi:MAG: hypothetical protein QOF78_3115, partial [Phycisphaerales bacterium]|nr:hypothetical protein [Phycisphaerales bacterium]